MTRSGLAPRDTSALLTIIGVTMRQNTPQASAYQALNLINLIITELFTKIAQEKSPAKLAGLSSESMFYLNRFGDLASHSTSIGEATKIEE